MSHPPHANAQKQASDQALHIMTLPWPPVGFTTEILRLFLFSPHVQRRSQIMQIDTEELATQMFLDLREPKGQVFLAQQGRKIVGLMQVVPRTGNRTWEGHMLSIRQLLITEDAPENTAEALIQTSLAESAEPAELVAVSVPTADDTTMHQLVRAGFHSVSARAVAVAACPKSRPVKVAGIAFLPLQDYHLNSACATARDCLQCGLYSCDPSFWEPKTAKIHACPLVEHFQEGPSKVLVAQNEFGEVQGFAAYRRHPENEEYMQKSLASLEVLAIRAQASEQLEIALHRNLLAHLDQQGVDLLEIKVAMSDQEAVRFWGSHRSIGYRLVSTIQTMHKWIRTSCCLHDSYQPEQQGFSWPAPEHARPDFVTGREMLTELEFESLGKTAVFSGQY